jgi:hypothetical protein
MSTIARAICAKMTKQGHGYPLRRLLTSLDVLDNGYGDTIAAEGEDVAGQRPRAPSRL